MLECVLIPASVMRVGPKHLCDHVARISVQVPDSYTQACVWECESECRKLGCIQLFGGRCVHWQRCGCPEKLALVEHFQSRSANVFIPPPPFFFFYTEPFCSVFQAGLELTVYFKLAPSWWQSSCLSCSCTEIIGMHKHARLCSLEL